MRTAHGVIPTPIFMPVGTVGSVKAIAPDDLAAIGRKVLAEVGGFDEVIETKAGCTIFCHCGTNTLGVVFLRK